MRNFKSLPHSVWQIREKNGANISGKKPFSSFAVARLTIGGGRERRRRGTQLASVRRPRGEARSGPRGFGRG